MGNLPPWQIASCTGRNRENVAKLAKPNNRARSSVAPRLRSLVQVAERLAYVAELKQNRL